MDENYLVTKSNYFIMNSNYDLSLQEQKIILTLASLVRKDDEEFKPYKFKIAEFMELVGVADKSKYTEIPKITRELMKKVLEIQEGNTLLQVAWLNSARYEKGSGMVTLKFSPDLKPYMLQLKEKFTQYQLANILSMKSKYSSRVYEILKCNEFKKQGYIEIEIDELRKLLKTEGMYHQYQDLKRKIIIQTQKELKRLTDISFEFEEIKTGRKVTSLKFYIKQNKAKKAIEAIDEVSVAKESIDEESQKDTQVRSIIYKHKITEHEASCILKDANNNLDLIKQCYEYILTKDKINNVVGYMRKLVKCFNEPQSSYKVDSFNDYPQRKYDFDKLERGLLGWGDNEEGAN